MNGFDIREWWIEESDRLRPYGQDPVDDHLEAQAKADERADRLSDYTGRD